MKKPTQAKERRRKSTKRKEKMLTPLGMLTHEISVGIISKFKFKILKDRRGSGKCFGEAYTSGRALRKGEPSKIYIHPVTVVHSFTRPAIKAVAMLRGTDKKAMRRIEEKYRTFGEILTHELYHHIAPYESERHVIERTKKAYKSQTKRVFRKRRKSRAEKIKTEKK